MRRARVVGPFNRPYSFRTTGTSVNCQGSSRIEHSPFFTSNTSEPKNINLYIPIQSPTRLAGSPLNSASEASYRNGIKREVSLPFVAMICISPPVFLLIFQQGKSCRNKLSVFDPEAAPRRFCDTQLISRCTLREKLLHLQVRQCNKIHLTDLRASVRR